LLYPTFPEYRHRSPKTGFWSSTTPDHSSLTEVAEHPFLSPEWITAARELRAEYADRLPEPVVAARINVVITAIPHGGSDVMEGHIDTTEGQTIIDYDHLDDPDLTVTVDYDTAKAAFVTRDQEALMQAFFGGRILVEGDVSKLLALQSTPPGEIDPLVIEMYGRLNAFTAG